MNNNGRDAQNDAAHTFVVYVEDKPGVLNRVASLFRRRGFNIESLTVGHTEQEGVSRMTIVMNANDVVAQRVEANLYKLVNVLRVENVTYMPSVMRDLALIKVRAGAAERAEILEICKVFRARVVDMGHDALIVEITGEQEKIDGLVVLLKPFGILEMVNSGVVAMTRSVESPSTVESVDSEQTDEASTAA